MTGNVDNWKESAEPQLELLLRRGRQGGTLLAGLGMLVFVGSVVFSFFRLRQVEQEVESNRATIQQQDATLKRQRAEIEQNERRLATIAPAALRGFGREQGVTAEAAVKADEIQASLAAHDAVTRLAASQPTAASGQRVVYYAKNPTIDTNQQNFVESLRELGFTVEVVQPLNPARTSNALWFGRNVKPASVELVAQAMIRAGYPLQYVGAFANASDRKFNVIEIGARPSSIGAAALTTDLVSEAVNRARQD